MSPDILLKLVRYKTHVIASIRSIKKKKKKSIIKKEQIRMEKKIWLVDFALHLSSKINSILPRIIWKFDDIICIAVVLCRHN